MPNSSLIPAAGLAAIMAVSGTALSGVAAASEYRCERADQTVRRVEIAVEDPATGVPCEVVYWKDHEEPGVRRVLWNAQTDAGFCERKAKELVATLEDGGWECAAPSPTSPATQQAAAPPSPPDAPAQAGSQGAGTAEPSSPTPARPETAARPDPGQQATEQQATGQKATGQQAGDQTAGDQKGSSIRAALGPQPAPQPAPPSSPDQAAPDQAAPDQAAPGQPAPGQPADGGPQMSALPQTTALDSIIEQNLVRLNDGVEGEFAAEIGRYGDLDGDGLDDGLVFFTYQSERQGEARFIAAYLYDGENYTLAATRPVAGSDDRVQSAEVEAIEGGVISLRLNVLEPGDAACCPSGSRHQTLVLQDGQLVEVNSSSPRTDSPS